MILWLDLETYSEAPITNGVYAYAQHQTTEITLFAYAIDDAPAVVWDVTSDPMPSELDAVLRDAEVAIVAHNAAFDRTILSAKGFDLPVDRWHCTMAQALAHSLPAGLGTLCEVFKVPEDQAKVKEGKQLVQLFCKPRPKNMKQRRATAYTHPEQWEKFREYARMDVEAMRTVCNRMPSWNYTGFELALWRLDQHINDRGFMVDVDLCSAAIKACDAEQERLAARTAHLTNGEVESATQRDKLIEYILNEHGIAMPDMQSATLERRIEDPDLPSGVRDLLTVRLEATTTSVRKYDKFLKAVSPDGRMRGTLQFCGASRTGRWAGRLVQPQNFPRPTMKAREVEDGIEAFKSGAGHLVLESVFQTASNALRGVIVAAPGRKVVAADLSNIEGRVQAWLAGEEWKLQAFRDYDTFISDDRGNPKRKGHDLYVLAYANSFGIPPDRVTSDQRQKGKVQELALGYEGGVGAFVTFASAYRIDLEDMAAQALGSIPADIRAESMDFLDWLKDKGGNTYGLPDRVFIVCDAFKRAWRRAHPKIADLWHDLRFYSGQAISHPGVQFEVGRLRIVRSGAWLRIVLPSRRVLCYPDPKIEGNTISYMGINQYTRRWQRVSTYGGKLFENVCQAVARDVMASAMPGIEKAGYPIVLTVHDEIITEPPDSTHYGAEELSSLMAAGCEWSEGLPLAASGFEGYRYRKG